MAILDADHSQSTSAMADQKTTYRNKMVEPGRMKPHCIQIDASLVEVMDSPSTTAHAWTSGVIVDMIHTNLPDLNKAAVAGDGIARQVFGEE